jgi:hypothetical protein
MINVEQLEIYVDQTTEPVLVESEPLVTQMDRKSFLINACRPNYMSEFKHLEYLRREMVSLTYELYAEIFIDKKLP